MNRFVLIFLIFCFLSAVGFAEQNARSPDKIFKYQVQPFHHMEKHIPRDSFIQRGRSSGSTSHEVFIAIHQNNIPELKQSVLDRATPGHPLYQQWMNFEEVGNMVKNEEAYKAVVDWLEAYEVRITWTSPYEEYVKAIAPISTWETMLSTHFYEFEDLSHAVASSSKGRLFHRALEYWIPVELTKSIDAIFHTVQTPPRFKRKYLDGELKSSAKLGFSFKDKPYKTHLRVKDISHDEQIHLFQSGADVTVDFINNLYKIGSNEGSASLNQSVFETSTQFFSPSDLLSFQEAYNLPIQAAISIGGHAVTTCTENSTVACDEGNLDIQYMMGIAQQTASIFWYVSDQGDEDPFVLWIQEVVAEQYPPQSNSISWGENESAMSGDVITAWEIEAAKLTGRGVTIMVSSGDNGAPNRDDIGCECSTGYDPSFPATSQWVTAVGATMGPETGGPEVVCSSAQGGIITSGGGFSTFVPQPSYQNQTIPLYFARTASSPPPSGYSIGGRGYPDVSLIGVNYQVFINGNWYSTYGTSCSSPVFAAFVTLVNSARFRQNKGSIGFINPTLYNIGYNSTIGIRNRYNATFNDVTSGNNRCCSSSSAASAVCCNSGYTAVEGWDPTTGWGSIDFTDFAAIFGVTANYTADASNASNFFFNFYFLHLSYLESIIIICVIGGIVVLAVLYRCYQRKKIQSKVMVFPQSHKKNKSQKQKVPSLKKQSVYPAETTNLTQNNSTETIIGTLNRLTAPTVTAISYRPQHVYTYAPSF